MDLEIIAATGRSPSSDSGLGMTVSDIKHRYLLFKSLICIQDCFNLLFFEYRNISATLITIIRCEITCNSNSLDPHIHCHIDRYQQDPFYTAHIITIIHHCAIWEDHSCDWHPLNQSGLTRRLRMFEDRLKIVATRTMIRWMQYFQICT